MYRLTQPYRRVEIHGFNWTKIDDYGSLTSRGKKTYYFISVRGVPEQRPRDCIIELFSSSSKIKISQVRNKTNKSKVELLSRIVVLGDLHSDASIFRAVEKMKETALERESKNSYGSITSAYSSK
jgi:hypothetical protein